MKTENLSVLKIYRLSQEQYEREVAAGNLEENAFYLTPDNHTHMISEISELEEILEGKANAEHTHEIAEVDGLQNELDAIDEDLMQKAGSYWVEQQLNKKADSGHTHAATDITGIADFVCEQGIGDKTKYRIWSSGLVEIWLTEAVSLGSTAGNGITIDLPVSLKNPNSACCQVTSENTMDLIGSFTLTTNRITVFAANSYATVMSSILHVYIAGK